MVKGYFATKLIRSTTMHSGTISAKLLKIIDLSGYPLKDTEQEEIAKIFESYPNGLDPNDIMEQLADKTPKAVREMISVILSFSQEYQNAQGNQNLLTSPESVAKRFYGVSYMTREVMKGVYLNAKNEVGFTKTISLGNYNTLYCTPAEVFSPALKKNIRKIILIHNHPSGDTSPSEEDLIFTKKVVKGASLIGLSILDHIIIGKNGWFSFKKEGLI